MKRILLLCALIATFSFLPAQDSNNDPSRWTPEDIVYTRMERVGSAVFSPDGSRIVWSKARIVKEKDKSVSDLHQTLLDVEKDGMPVSMALTRADDSDRSPVFSADGKTLYFLSSRNKGKKLWSLSMYGGEAEEVKEFDMSISGLQRLGDSALVFVAHEGETLLERQRKKIKDDTQAIEDTNDWKITRIFRFDLNTKEVKRLTENKYPISSYAVSRDGRWMVTRRTMSPHYGIDAQPANQYDLYDLANGTHERILQGLQTPGSFQFTADNQGFYFEATVSSDPQWTGAGISILYYFDLAKKGFLKVPLDADWGIGGGYDVVGNHALVSLANGPTNTLAFYHKTPKGWNKSVVDLGEKNDHVTIDAISQDGQKVLFHHSTMQDLPRYFTATLTQDKRSISVEGEKEVVKVNGKLKKKPLAKGEVLRWEGALGEEVNGLLYYPENYESGKRYPLVISIHGGPSGVDRDSWSERWSTYPQLFAQRGAFVLKPNYHGSSNHGQKFVESIKGHYYDLELEDITKGIQVLYDKGMVDTTEMGVMGWSNGAILATMLTVRHPDMFKVAAAGAGDVNWTSDYGTCGFGVQFDQSYFGGAPWDDVEGKFYNEAYVIKSPLFELEKVKTPTIIFHGSEDRAVPRDQGWEYYRALQQVGKAPVRFLWFPNQPHGLGKISHQLRKMKEELAWIDTYLFDTHKPENPSFDPESPLAQLLKRQKLESKDGLMGVTEQGKIIPQVQVLKADSIAIGCLEVTNAQYAAFNTKHAFSPEKANHPATNISLNQATAYTTWLSKLTGETYRLPNAAEAKALHKQAKKLAAKENTLAYWAGYNPTMDEVDALREKLNEATMSLIQQGGEFKAARVGKAEVYDLGGNVAELDASGQTYGYSAYDAADAAGEQPQAVAAHTGFRVIREE